MAAGGSDGAGIARAVRLFESAVAALSRAGEWIAGVACLATLGLVCYAVVLRYFFNKPQSWLDEAVGLLIVISVMLAVPEAQRRGENIGVDLVIDRLKGKGRRALVAFGTRRRTLGLSVLWQTAIPITLGLVLSLSVGLTLGAVLLKMTGFPVAVDWLGVLSMTGIGAGVVLLVTALSMPPLVRLMRPEGLRTE